VIFIRTLYEADLIRIPIDAMGDDVHGLIDLTSADLINIELIAPRGQGASYHSIDLSKSDLHNASFEGLFLNDVKFEGADMELVNLRRTEVEQPASYILFRYAILDRADFSFALHSEGEFEGTQLNYAKMYHFVCNT